MSIIPYEAGPSWVDLIVTKIKDVLMDQASILKHTAEGDNRTGCDIARHASEMIADLKLSTENN